MVKTAAETASEGGVIAPNQLTQLLEIISTTLEVPLDNLGAASSNETIENWDSMKVVELAVAFEQTFGVTFDAAEVVEMISVRRIVDILQSHSAF